MQRRRRRSLLIALATAAVAMIVFAACDPAPPPPPPPNAAQNAAAAKSDMVARTNYMRSVAGLQVEAVDGTLANFAQFHADRLAAGATSCSSIWHSGEAYSWYAGRSWGENVACVGGCPADAGGAFEMWRNSPGHNANIYKPEFARIGIGVSCSGSVQMVVAHYTST